ncbi:MAG TPA: PilZ domain-containing protein, partial [Planctomycetota bacterium]|nr:PilZ domain-containing protein [Planctomycetota bacterium]
MGAERREHTRVPKHVLIRMRCVGGPVPKEADDRVATIENISKGGLGVASRKFYPPGTVLQMAFPESSMGPARTLYASVVRAGPSAAGNGYDLALQFVRAP